MGSQFFIRRYFAAASQAAQEVLGPAQVSPVPDVEAESCKADFPERFEAINMAYGSTSFRDSFKRKLEATGGIDCNHCQKTASGEGTRKKSRTLEGSDLVLKEVRRQCSLLPLKSSHSMACHFILSGVKATATTLVSSTPPHGLTHIDVHWGQMLTLTFLFTASSYVHGEERRSPCGFK